MRAAALLALLAATALGPRAHAGEAPPAPRVENPAEPAGGTVDVRPAERWRAEDDEDAGVIFGVIVDVACADDGTAYLLDTQQSLVQVYDADGQWLRTIGGEGEGPGEFRRASSILVDSDGAVVVLQAMPGRIVRLTPEGDPLDEWPLPRGDGGGRMFAREAARAGRDLVLAVTSFRRREAGVTLASEIVRATRRGTVSARYASVTIERDFASMEFDEKAGAWPIFAVGPDERVYVHTDFDAYAVTVYAPDGTPERLITRAYEHRVRTSAERERNRPRVRMRRNGRRMNVRSVASPTDRDVLALFPRPDGALWVLSSHGAFDAPDGVLAVFDEFDPSGRFVRRVRIHGEGHFAHDRYVMQGERLFVIRGARDAMMAMRGMGDDEATDEEPEPISVLCYDLSSHERSAN